MAAKAIIFDCFGVLTSDGWLPFRDKYFGHDQKLLEQAMDINRLVDSGLLDYKDYIDQLSSMSKVPLSEVRHALESHVPNQTLFSYIKNNLKLNYKLGILSNISGGWLDSIFQPEQINLFDEVVLSYQIGAIKPDRAMYDAIVKKLDVDYRECVFIDDQPRYCEGAKSLGIKTILFKSNEQAMADLEALLEKSDA